MSPWFVPTLLLFVVSGIFTVWMSVNVEKSGSEDGQGSGWVMAISLIVAVVTGQKLINSGMVWLSTVSVGYWGAIAVELLILLVGVAMFSVGYNGVAKSKSKGSAAIMAIGLILLIGIGTYLLELIYPF